MSDSLPNTKYPFFNMSTDPVLRARASGCSSSQPQPTKNKKLLINIQNEDAKCCKHCIECHAFKIYKKRRIDSYIIYAIYIYIYIWIYIFIWCAYMYIYYIYTYYKRRISPDGNFLYNMGLPKMFNASCEICTEENNHDHKVTINFWIWVLFFVGKKAQHNSNQLETLKGGAEYNRQLPFNQKAAC